MAFASHGGIRLANSAIDTEQLTHQRFPVGAGGRRLVLTEITGVLGLAIASGIAVTVILCLTADLTSYACAAVVATVFTIFTASDRADFTMITMESFRTFTVHHVLWCANVSQIGLKVVIVYAFSKFANSTILTVKSTCGKIILGFEFTMGTEKPVFTFAWKSCVLAVKWYT